MSICAESDAPSRSNRRNRAAQPSRSMNVVNVVNVIREVMIAEGRYPAREPKAEYLSYPFGKREKRAPVCGLLDYWIGAFPAQDRLTSRSDFIEATDSGCVRGMFDEIRT